MPSKPTHGGARPGSGRPSSGRTGITLRLAAETVEALSRMAPTRLEQAALIDSLVSREAARLARKNH
ncbi:hypothetical protein UFOVP1004_25 [uncultured Caudovirales phage]|uniref:Uncharacterized protein n=1 Tax=uncultured Caudovirales phage TaxID=2100421 RepID=A0A6J5Q908_9CAUD|nr:hypothetical protein UFOVP1004_25 [uncultured Caudovirales phage]